MNRNTYESHSPTQATAQSQISSYISDIQLAQNRLRTKLPQIISYQPNSHFDYLSENSKYISSNTLQQIIPFKDQKQHGYAGFQPLSYINRAVHELNNGDNISNKNSTINSNMQQFGSDHGLNYQGYIRLVTSKRMINYSGGSQVNISIFNRNTLQKDILNKQDKSKVSNSMKKADSVVGMLLFLQCLKIHETTHNYDRISKDISVTHNKNMMNTNIHQTNLTQSVQKLAITQQTFYHPLPSLPPKYKTNMMPITPTNRQNTHHLNNPQLSQYYQNEYYPQLVISDINISPRKPIFSFHNKAHHNKQVLNNQISTKLPVVQSKQLKYQTVQTWNSNNNNNTHQNWAHSPFTNTNLPQQQQQQQQNTGFLSRFSSEANIWKNVAPRNWDYKQEPTTKRSASQMSISNAFIYEDVSSTPRTYFNNMSRRQQRSIPKRRINY